MGFRFAIRHRCPVTQARLGQLQTPHGPVDTPRFMPVGTSATVKGLTTEQLGQTRAQMVLANAYHLHLQPGEDCVAAAGGLHRFMAWDGPILTDSGGYQVFSLAGCNRVEDHGVTFRSPRDGRTIQMTPERSMAIQNRLGADVIMAFDHCPPAQAGCQAVEAATDRTHRWLERCIAAHGNQDQALFGIVQGGCHGELRRWSAATVCSHDLPGFAIGGVSVGESTADIHQVVKLVTPLLPEHKPRYLMGVGSLAEMAQAVAQGVDLFDCVLPTRLGRHGTALVEGDAWSLKRACFRGDHRPLDASCPCWTCRHHSRAYLHHLIHSRELLAASLLSLHNLTHLQRFCNAMGKAIVEGTFAEHFTPWDSASPAASTW